MQRCIICFERENDGFITHKKYCPDYSRPGHKTKVKIGFSRTETAEYLRDDQRRFIEDLDNEENER